MTKLLFQLGRRSLLRSRALVGALPSPVLGLSCRSPFQVHFREAYHVEGCASCAKHVAHRFRQAFIVVWADCSAIARSSLPAPGLDSNPCFLSSTFAARNASSAIF